ncbi:MAG: cytidylate kinase-like family protein [Treponema sp.]|jgi:cytidylate kinase|nr:cytidylate kinase-like family protein [Treponema sp.]
MGKKIVTVSREFGSGGRSAAKMIAERLGYAYCDNSVIAGVAREHGLSEVFVNEYGEYAISKHPLVFDFAIDGANRYDPKLSIYDQLFIFQHNYITDLAEKEPCVIVGRCADFILQERTDCLHAFFYADMNFRVNRISNSAGEQFANPAKHLDDMDKRRKAYYQHYTGRCWGESKNYHICLNTGVIGLEHCADIVVELAKR